MHFPQNLWNDLIIITQIIQSFSIVNILNVTQYHSPYMQYQHIKHSHNAINKTLNNHDYTYLLHDYLPPTSMGAHEMILTLPIIHHFIYCLIAMKCISHPCIHTMHINMLAHTYACITTRYTKYFHVHPLIVFQHYSKTIMCLHMCPIMVSWKL